MSEGLTATQVTWLSQPCPEWRVCEAKIRYNSPPAPARVRMQDDVLEVVFDAPMEAITPGQAVVCYDGEQVLGGGWIDTVMHNEVVS